MSELKEVFTSIYQNWGFGGNESRSGPGSSLDETEKIRNQIRKLVHEKNIKTVVDIPCGDFNWMKEIVYGFEKYTGGDIVPDVIVDNQKYANQIINFIEFDLTEDVEIPEADLLIVRDVIGHLPLEKGKAAIENILKSKCKYLLSTTWYNINDPQYYTRHNENREVDIGRFYPVCLLSNPFNFPAPEFYFEEQITVANHENGNRKGLGFWNLEEIRRHRINTQEVTPNLTLVTGLWNINRVGRDFSEYIENFKKFLNIPANMFIYLPRELEYLVWENRQRNKTNTHVRIFELSDIKNNLYAPFWEKTQEIRTSSEWYSKTGEQGWLKNSPQATLEYYNPIVQSKMFMLHDAKIMNVFDTDYFLWLDAGITNTVYDKYLTENRCFDKIIPLLKTFLFLSYPYEAVDEIHGFDFQEMNRITNQKVKYVCRGGLFGGHKDFITQANSTYYQVLAQTLVAGYMGTEESIFSIMANLEPHIYRRYGLDDNGLIVKFIQALIGNTIQLENVGNKAHVLPKGVYNKTISKTSLYVLSFNFPKQFRTLLQSFEKHTGWLRDSRKILINNSSDQTVISEYDKICTEYGFEHIATGENLGINRGRLFAANHFHESDSDYYFFFEDDMCLHAPELITSCRNGFKKGVRNLYKTVHEIMAREELDFLKLSYSEVYMDNNIQVSWYNVPQSVRSEIWPDYDQLPISGLDPHAPRTKFNRIEVHDEISYAIGEVYYANWPMIVSREGNKKMFLDTKWEHPYEQTWMSYMFQETVAGNLKPAVLLASPINHNRIFHYSPDERREN
jgi:hypothetical protein